MVADGGVSVSASECDLLAYVDDYIAHIARYEGASPETVRAYTQHLEAYVRWCARSGVNGLSPNPRDLRLYLSDFASAGYAPRTTSAHLSALRSFFTWLVEEGIVTSEVVSALSSPKLDKPLPHTLTLEQLERLMKRLTPQRLEGCVMPPCWSSSSPRGRVSRSSHRLRCPPSTLRRCPFACSARALRSVSCPCTIGRALLALIILITVEASCSGVIRRQIPSLVFSYQIAENPWMPQHSGIASTRSRPLLVCPMTLRPMPFVIHSPLSSYAVVPTFAACKSFSGM
mgnify:CR=1 FL=1